MRACAKKQCAVRSEQCAAGPYRAARLAACCALRTAHCALRTAHCALVLATTLIAAAIAPAAQAQTTRIASDFEIQQMERQAATSSDFASQISAHLNLGDLRRSRSETALARAEYRKAAEIAQRERTDSRADSNLSRYARATMFAALTEARLNHEAQAFQLAEEALRYASDDAEMWNIYSSATRVLGLSKKAVSAARNALSIAEAALLREASTSKRLDVEVYRYSLATALDDAGEPAEARRLLESEIRSLQSPSFAVLRKDAARREAFEIYSTVRSGTDAYLSLLNRAQLHLAAMYEREGETAGARKVYESVLQSRSDDPTALAALARLATSESERVRSYADAFDANPFSIDLVREYRKWLAEHRRQQSEGASDGAMVRRALEAMARGENRDARTTLDALATKFPGNDVVQYLAAVNDLELGDYDRARGRSIHDAALQRELISRMTAPGANAPAFLHETAATVQPSAAELRQLLAALQQQRLTPEERVALDRITLTSSATFAPAGAAAQAGQSVFESGTIDGLPFRFSEPMAFAGEFAPGVPLRLTYHILGVTQVAGGDGLLLEPVKVEAGR